MSGIGPAIDLLGFGEDLPGNPSDLVRKCDDDLVAMHALFELLNQLAVPAGGLGDFFGPGTTVGIPFAAQLGVRVVF